MKLLTPAPIILFVYNRPDHTRQTVEALVRNDLARDSELWIFSDGSKNSGADEQVSEVRKNSKIIAEQTTRITKIIKQMLNLAQQKEAEFIEVDLAQAIRDILDLMEMQISQTKIKVEIQLPDNLPKVKADPDGLQQVLINLIVNALQTMGDEGLLTISSSVEQRRKGGLELAAPQQFITFAVGDTGKGVPADLQEKIFEPFFSTKRKGEGTGLGLSVVHGIIKQHDGWIDVDVEPGQGTTFRVYLPLEMEK